MIRLEVMACRGPGTQDAFVRLEDVSGVGRSYLDDNNDYAAECRVVFLRGGGELAILDTPENMLKLGLSSKVDTSR